MEDLESDVFTVVNTRPAHQASDLSERLRGIGMEPIECPALDLVEPASWEPVDRALKSLSSYDWLVFTSQNGVHRCFDRARRLDRVETLRQIPAAAIGSATAGAIREHRGTVSLVPDDFRSEGLADALIETLAPNTSVLIPRSNIARPVLVDRLTDAGLRVNEVHPYELRRPTDPDSPVLERLRSGQIDLLSFTSSMIVRNFDELLRENDLETLRSTPAACIGPVTGETARERGFETPIVAEEYTIDGLVRAIRRQFRNCTRTT